MRTSAERPSLAELHAEIAGPLARALGRDASALTFLPLGDTPLVVDGTTKVLVRAAHGGELAVVLCSAPSAPDMVARGVRRARAAREALGRELGDVVLEPLLEGEIGGASYVALPHCPSLSNARFAWWVQRIGVRAELLRWLRAATEATAREATSAEVEALFRAPLRHVVDGAEHLAALRDDARAGLTRIEAGSWRPRAVLVHGDLWKGNVLLRGKGAHFARQLVLIDWPASVVRGHALYDLARLAESFGCRGARLRREVTEHCRILGCETSDARAHLAAALGHVAMNLENFPPEIFRRMVASCVSAFDSARI